MISTALGAVAIFASLKLLLVLIAAITGRSISIRSGEIIFEAKLPSLGNADINVEHSESDASR